MSALNATYPSPNTTVSTGGVAALYHQCGGINWTGATKCEAGSYCKVQNDFYFQCVANEGAYTNATATGSNGKPTRIHPLKCLRPLFQCLTCTLPKADYINTLLASGPASARPTTLVTITASSSAAAATPTGTDADDEDDYCEDEEPASISASATPTPSAAAASEEDDYCEGEETVTVSVSATPAPSAAAAAEEEGDDYCEE